MYSVIPIWLAIAFVAVGLYALAWSADRFVGGAEAVSRARLGIADRAYRHRGGNLAARACIRHCLCPSRTERTDARQHNRLKLLQLACGCRNERGDIAIQGRFAACLHARPARHVPPYAFHRDLWIQPQKPTLIRHNLPSMRDHLACCIPCLYGSSYPAYMTVSLAVHPILVHMPSMHSSHRHRASCILSRPSSAAHLISLS